MFQHNVVRAGGVLPYDTWTKLEKTRGHYSCRHIQKNGGNP